MSAILADVDENRSVWLDGKPDYRPLPPLGADLDCDVAVIGGGLCGVSSAWHFSQQFPEQRVVLLEARALANGASGRNGGLVLNWVNGVDTADLERAKLVYDTTREGIDLLERAVTAAREAGHDVPFRRTGTLDVITDPARAEEAAREVERLRGAGVPLEFLAGDALLARLRLAGAHGAIHDPSTGQLDGVSLLRALRPLLVARGVHVYEGTPVLRVEEGETITLHTPVARVRARAVVLATNAYTPSLGYFRSGLVPLHSHAIATEPLDAEAWRAIGWSDLAGFSDDLDRVAYGSLTRDGRLVFGGGSNAAYGYVFGSRARYDRSADRGFDAVHQRLLAYLPRARDVKITRRWTGTVAITLSRVCAIGVTGEHRNVYYGVGFSGHGITLAFLAGRVLADVHAGDAARWRRLPFFDQKLLYVPPEPLRWLGYHAFVALTGKSPRRSV